MGAGGSLSLAMAHCRKQNSPKRRIQLVKKVVRTCGAEDRAIGGLHVSREVCTRKMHVVVAENANGIISLGHFQNVYFAS